MRLAWKQEQYDTELERMSAHVARLEKNVEALAEADRIAEAVAEAIREEPPPVGRALTEGLTPWQRWGAFLGAAAAAAIILADSVRGLVG